MKTQHALFGDNVCRDCGAWEGHTKKHLLAVDAGPPGRLCWTCIEWPPCAVCGAAVQGGTFSEAGLTHDECASQFAHKLSKPPAKEDDDA